MTKAKGRLGGWLRGTWRLAIATAIVVMCAAAPGSSQAQSPTTRSVKITLEQRHIIRELVRELKVNAAKDDLKVGEGDQIPGNIELQPVPPLIGQKVPQVKAHRLYVTARQILLIDPQDKSVVEVIE